MLRSAATKHSFQLIGFKEKLRYAQHDKWLRAFVVIKEVA
jgi:hypothetical protein